MAEVPGTGPIFRSRRKAISALFPYAVRLAQDGQWRMLDIILRVASNSTSGFMWRCIGPYITTLFDKSTPSSLNQAITFASPCADWIGGPYTERAVTRWAAAVSETPYSVEVGQSVVDALLQIAYNDSLRPYIPIDIWGWLKRRPSLPPVCRGRYLGMTPGVVQHIRRLRDAGILKSYFLLVWSEWDIPDHHELPEMGTAIKVFNGTGMHRHRGDLLKRLNHVLKELNQGVEHLKQLKPQMDEDHIRNGKRRYKWLRRTLAGEGFEGGAIEDTVRIYYSNPFQSMLVLITIMSRIFLIDICSLVHDPIFPTMCITSHGLYAAYQQFYLILIQVIALPCSSPAPSNHCNIA